jgi:nucleolar protein 9
MVAFMLSRLHQSRGVLPKIEESSDKGELRTLTQLILDFSEVCLKLLPAYTTDADERLHPKEILPSLPALIMDQFASHIVRALFLLLCPHLFQSDAPHKSQSFVRSRKSVAWKAKQGSLKSIFDDVSEKGKVSNEGGGPSAFRELARRFVMMLRTTLGANEIRSLAANKVACPVLQVRGRIIHRSSSFTCVSVDGARVRSRSGSGG